MFISPSSFSGVFVLPSAIADGALKTASGSFLKVIIYIYRNCAEPVDAARISASTGVPEGEVGDALRYWADKGFLTEGEPAPAYALPQTAAENTPAPTEKTAETTARSGAKKIESNETGASDISPEKEKKEHITVRPKPLTYDVICRRTDESAEVRTLFSEAQMRLGRIIGSGDQSSLLLLHDYYGLPVEVILALCEYARASGKSGNMNYIYTVGVDWSKREIDTLEEADEEFKRIQELDKNWAPFCEITGIKRKKPTAKQSEYLASWIDRYHFTTEMLACAYEEMSRHTSAMSFPYMNKILTVWYSAGVDTPEKVKAYEQEFIDKTAKKAAEREAKKKNPYGIAVPAQTEQKPASYDIEKAQQRAKAAVPTLKKKEKR